MLHLSVSYCLDMDRISFYPSEHLFLKALDACFSFFSFFYWKFIRKIIKTTLEFAGGRNRKELEGQFKPAYN